MTDNVSDQLRFEVDGDGVAVITLNRPEKLNAFSPEMRETWLAALEECRTGSHVKVIVITGTGRAFSTGGDVGRFDASAVESPVAMRERIMDTQRLALAFEAIDKPVIAALNGLATGGGLDIALMCDLRFAAQSARFAQTYNRLGMIPGAGGAYYLPRVVGASRALKMFWGADFVESAEALRIGLVDEVYPDAELMAQTLAFARRIAGHPSLALRLTKTMVYQSLATDLRTSLNLAASTMPLVRSSDDHKEAVAAFKEKRKPRFTGK